MTATHSPSDQNQTLRLLGLVFAGADLVFEIDTTGQITFALGAAERLTGHADAALMTKNWSELVGPDDRDLLAALLGGLKPGERQGPLRVTMASRGTSPLTRFASLSIFRLPQLNAKISCALSLGAPAGLEMTGAGSSGLMAAETFTAAASKLLEDAERAGLQLRMDLVDMPGLAAELASLSPTEADATRRRVAATLRAESYAGLGGAEISQDRYALVRSATASTERLSEKLAASTGGAIVTHIAQLPFKDATPDQNMRAMRYALDRFIEEGPEAAAEGFMATVERTMRDTTRFKTIVASGNFNPAFQPEVSLTDRSLHHFEALARFDADSSPAETIRLAEELEMITQFDLAVVTGVAKAIMAAGPTVRIAANISAHSLMRDQFVEDIIALVNPALRPRLMLEITETRQIDDLDRANQVISKLRKLGHIVCLDDFGAGFASLDYLRKLEIDIVKIDGRYIQNLKAGSRDALLVKHIVRLCTDLKMTTIAEMIETEDCAKACFELGADLGQGWTFAKALPEPKWSPPLAPAPAVARRAGSRETWG